ncbi:MAG: SDR family NAD(P)-dependent oxidoreductase [Anaerolineae bacterium]|nr:SDR family NAD(P)-dependent oxidoreductase [Anaerolineae bacterium]
MAKTRVILITGASTGIGLATAKLLAAQGHCVFGTSRQPEKYAITDFTLLRLDVREDESVATCVDAVLAQAGRIDVLVNNAAVSLSGAAEEASIEDAKRLFETNFFGVLRMVNAVLPIMRRQRSGQIINISSLAGIMGVPYIGLYSASKHALEGYSEALRYEVKSFGIRVALVEPGDTRTDIAVNTPAPEHKISDYDGRREQVNAMHTANVANGTSPDRIAQAIANVIDNPRPGLRKPITKGLEFFVPLARRFLPYFLIEPNIRDHYKLDS